MVFTNENWNDTNEIIVYSNYHKYWLDKDRKIVNPLFDVFSGKILDLKEGKPEAVRYFYNLLDDEICKATCGDKAILSGIIPCCDAAHTT